MATTSPSTISVAAALRTLAVLEFVAGSSRPVSASDIARATEMNPSTSFNITRTLVGAGYLQPVPGTKFYTTGPTMQGLARKVSHQAQPLELAKLPMQALANKWEVAVSLWRRTSRYSMTMLVAVESQAATRIQVTAGAHQPLMHGSMGRLMALRADLTENERREVHAVVNAERPVSYRSYMQQARLAAQRGWSLDDGHIRTTVTAVSVPVETNAPSLEYVCTAVMFRGQYADEKLEALAAELTDVATRLGAVCADL